MKILHVYTGGGEIYGAERVILNLLTEQIKLGVDASIAYFKRPGSNSFLELLKEHKIQINEIRSSGKFDIGALLELNRICQNSQPDIIHSHGYKADILLAIMKHKSCSSRLVSTKHGWTSATPLVQLYEFLGDAALRYFDKVIAVSHPSQAIVRKHVQDSKLELITNGIDLSLYRTAEKGHLRREIGLDNSDTLIGCIARLSPEKGLMCLIEAAKIICSRDKNSYFVLIGDGPLRESLESFILDNNLKERVFLLGWRKNIAQALVDIDIVVLPSLKEGMPMILLESIASMTPTIATNVGGVSEVIKNMETGILIEPNDPEEITQAIEFLSDNEVLKDKLSAQAYKLVESRYSSEIMAAEYIDVYRELLI